MCEGNKQKAREQLDLVSDKKIVFSYGWAPELHIFPVLSALQELNKQVPFTFLVLAEPKYIVSDIQRLKECEFIENNYVLEKISEKFIENRPYIFSNNSLDNKLKIGIYKII